MFAGCLFVFPSFVTEKSSVLGKGGGWFYLESCVLALASRAEHFSHSFLPSSIACFFFFFLNIYLFYLFWLCWVFVSVRVFSLVAASGGHSSSQCAGLSLSRPPLLGSTGSRRAGSVIGTHGPSRSAACGIFPDQGSNPCPLHWQADSQPLRHQGSPIACLLRPCWMPGSALDLRCPVELTVLMSSAVASSYMWLLRA